MFEIDKEKFGAFVATLRKEKGYTQKEMAQRLLISDKAVSKWETGASIPDITLLIPLSNLLGITVTELLMCRRIEKAEPLDAERIEDIVKQTITYSADEKSRIYQNGRNWTLLYISFLAVFCVGAVFLYSGGYMTNTVRLIGIMGAIFGAYLCLFAKERLPNYYDEYKISTFSDGFFRMNVPGLSFNNSNWPNILNTLRVWSLAAMSVYPAFFLLLDYLAPALWTRIELAATLILMLGGLFVPVYVVGKKYE